MKVFVGILCYTVQLYFCQLFRTREVHNIPAVACKIENLSSPEVSLVEVQGSLELAKVEETKWTEKAQWLLIKDKFSKDDFVSWAAFHASTQPECLDPPALTALLPLFPEKAATIAMVKHGMDTLREIMSYLNPGQVRQLQKIFLLLAL